VTRERGSVTVFAMGAVAFAMVLLLGIARVGGAAVLRARADSAADAAALAAADALALARGESAAEQDAAATARANGARLVSCVCRGLAAEVEVVVEPGAASGLVRPARGYARAEVDLSRQFTGDDGE
jgi:secretion/DNA translocation related TadE-like protein